MAKGSGKPVKVAKKTAPKKRATKEAELTAFNPGDHELVPKHEKLSKKEAKDVMERYHTSLRELPKIKASDPAILGIGVKAGDIIKITRTSPTAGETIFYRGVINE